MSSKSDRTRARILDAAERLVLEKGFSGTTLSDIVKATDLTKGAFFHHFDSKDALARALVERYAARDMDMFRVFDQRAAELTDDPLQGVLIFLKLFEEFIEAETEPLAGCLFSSYVYESRQFDASILTFIRNEFSAWSGIYERRFAAVMATREPAAPVTAAELAEMIICIIEGGFVLSRAFDDPLVVARQSRHFRQYLKLLFGA